MHNFRFGRHSHHILILLQVPLTTFRHRFQLFKVTTFPVHVTGQQSHITELRDLPSYYSISRNGRKYFTLDRDDDTVLPALLFMTDKQIDFHNLDTGISCVSALFHNDIDSVHQFCTFRLSIQPLKPHIKFLGDGKILMTNLSRVALQCNGAQILIPYCIHCIRTVPCHCAFTISLENSSIPHTFWPQRLTQCPRSFNVTNVAHIVNLATLQSFFSRASLGALNGDSYPPQPLSVSLPDFCHFRHKLGSEGRPMDQKVARIKTNCRHKFQGLLSADRAKSHDLHKFAARVKNHTLIYDDLADVVLHDSDNWQSTDLNFFTPRFTAPSWWMLWSSLFGVRLGDLCVSSLPFTRTPIAVFVHSRNRCQNPH